MIPQDYLNQFIVPAAKALGVYTLPHLQIGFGTAAQESGFRDISQTGGGPARGPWQMEINTHTSLWENYVGYRQRILATLNEMLGRTANDTIVPDPAALETNLLYAASMMFIRYLDAPGAIPPDLSGQAEYYVRFYNSGGKATVTEYINNWNQFSVGVSFPAFSS
jgi:hypothetical protein